LPEQEKGTAKRRGHPRGWPLGIQAICPVNSCLRRKQSPVGIMCLFRTSVKENYRKIPSYNYLFHLDLAAFFAISLRRFAVNFDALASPPFNPPRRPRLVATVSSRGIRVSSGEPSICSPMARSTTDKAVAVKSSLVPFDLTLNGFTDPILTQGQEPATGVGFQTDPLPVARILGCFAFTSILAMNFCFLSGNS
jgi:hypothetical protein